MRNRRIGLIDLGLDAAFDASMRFVQSTIENINAGYGHDSPIADVDFVRTRSLETVAIAFTAPVDVLHVMAHGDATYEPTFTSTDGKTQLSMGAFGEWCADSGYGVSSGAVLADGCRTATGAWQKAVRDCLQGPITYIGTSAYVGWHDGTVFASAFYSALFRNKGKGATPSQQAEDAANRAMQAFSLLTGRPCPYRVLTLEPSRRARKAFGG